MARADSSKAASQQPASAPEAHEQPAVQAAPVATPQTLTEDELVARYEALQQARVLRAQREDLAASVVALQRKLAELETDVAYAMRRALAPVGAA